MPRQPALTPTSRSSILHLIGAALLVGAVGPVTSVARAQEPTVEADTPAEEPAPKRAGRGAKLDFEFNFRFRRMTVPRGFMSIWYTDSGDTGWPLANEDRPYINGYAYGLEFVAKNDRANAIVWVDWIDSSMPTGYWDDADDPPDFDDGDYLEPSPNLGLLAVGADYAYEIPLVRLDQTRRMFGLGMYVGGGLGVGVMMGRLERWIPDDDTDTPAYLLYQEGQPANANEKNLTRVYPIVDFNLGLRLNFARRFILRLEGGLHTMLYYGAAAGFQF